MSSDDLLRRLYTGEHEDQTAAFVNSPARFYKVAKKYVPKITHDQVRRFIRAQPDWQVQANRPNPARAIPRWKAKRHILTSRTRLYGCIDVMVLRRLKGAGLFKFAVVLEDGFSRKLRTAYLKRLTPKNTALAIVKICKVDGIVWFNLWTDRGVEFGKIFDEIVLDREKIAKKHFFTAGYSPNATSMCERSIKNLRQKANQLIRSGRIPGGRNRGMRSVQMAVKLINDQFCSTIAMTPNQADLPHNAGRVLENIRRWREANDVPSSPVPRFKTGQKVRLKIQPRDRFRKAGEHTYSQRLYTVERMVKTEPLVSYRLRDVDGGLVRGTISEADLLAA